MKRVVYVESDLVEDPNKKKSKVINALKNIFSKQPKLSTDNLARVDRGFVEEVEFATEEWEEWTYLNIYQINLI